MEELKKWLEEGILFREKKIENMKRLVPDHRNIKAFEGEISMSKMTINKINEILNRP